MRELTAAMATMALLVRENEDALVLFADPSVSKELVPVLGEQAQSELGPQLSLFRSSKGCRQSSGLSRQRTRNVAAMRRSTPSSCSHYIFNKCTTRMWRVWDTGVGMYENAVGSL